jgi:hypothetical protein
MARNWRFQWPFRWPITWSKPALPALATLRFPDYCNVPYCSQKQWTYRPNGKHMGFCYRHLQKYDWVPSAEAETVEQPVWEHANGSWKEKETVN